MARQRDLTSRGWRRDTVFEKDHYRDALLTLLERAADAGRTRHLLLLADEQIVGFLLGFREGGTVLAFLTAVDDRFLAYGPGGVLFWEYMERALSAGDIQRIEFGVGTTFVKDTVSNAGEAPVEASWDPPAPPLGRLRRRAYDGLTALRAARQSR
jgi:CelD/BcsL family acetyltransferase involved in cellulose biosynthesis